LLTNEGHVKIAEQGASSSIEKSGYFKALTYGEIVYLSPLLLKSLLRRELRPQHNPFKSDVFSLGMTMLECCALLTARSCYEYEQGRINYEVVRDFLQNASSQYSQFLMNVI
jgi:serine/threonine protein kinase